MCILSSRFMRSLENIRPGSLHGIKEVFEVDGILDVSVDGEQLCLEVTAGSES